MILQIGLSLPLEAVTETLGFLGRRGQGKSYAAQRVAEEMHRCGAQFVTLDPVGIWYGLRLASDGKSPGLPIPVLGGLHGDIPLEAGAGALIADLVADRGVSMVLDVSQFESDADKARFARAFADRFYFRKKAAPSAVHLFLEEAQEFVPQNPQREEAHMLHAFTRIAKIGRNYGIGVSLISQRPQEVNKKVLNLTELLFAFQLTGPQERKTLQGWIADKGIDEDIESILPKLERGAPHVWSPAWLKISKVVQISKRVTFDASSTPKVGKDAQARELSPIDLEELQVAMAATIEKAKADDPRLLRKRIAELERARPASGAPVGPRREDLATITALRKALEEAMKVVVKINALDFFKAGGESLDQEEIEKAIKSAAQSVAKMVERHLDKRNAEFDAVRREAQRVLARLKGLLEGDAEVHLTVRHNEPFTISPPTAVRRAPPPDGSNGSGSRDPEVGRGGLYRILVALAQRPQGLNQRQLGLRATLSSRSGSFATYLSKARSSGWIEGSGDLRITSAGIKALGHYEPLPEGRDLLNHWLGELGSSGASRILRVLAEAYPKSMTQEATGQAANLSDRSGSFATYLSKLRGLELITGRGELRASDELFG